jgi:hypothetical protein
MNELVQRSFLGMLAGAIVLFGLLAALEGRVRMDRGTIEIVIGLEFALSVADRFGVLGPPGHGVTWGNFANFVVYTKHVNAFLPAGFAFPLAVLATTFETIAALGSFSGFAAGTQRCPLRALVSGIQFARWGECDEAARARSGGADEYL